MKELQQLVLVQMVGEGLSERGNLSQDLDVEKEPAMWKSEEGTFETGATA